jgi:recombination protein RecT
MSEEQATYGIEKAKQPETIGTWLAGKKAQFSMALPKHITADRFLRVTLTAINKTPKLLQCTRESLLSALMDCSQFGLEPDGRNAHLIPYKNEVKLIFDYKGMVQLARNSGEVADIHADIVCENDAFEYSYGTEGKLIHKPALSNRGKVTQVYSFVKFKDGAWSYDVMSVEEVEAVKLRSEAWKAYKAGYIKTTPWLTDWNEMAKKTIFRRHSKWLPISSEKFKEALEKDFDTPYFSQGLPDIQKEIEMPREKVVAKKEAVPQTIAPEIKPDPDAVVSDKLMTVLEKMMKTAGVDPKEFVNRFQKTTPDGLTRTEYQKATIELGKLIDEKNKVK